jgi:hypothetical protein
MFPILIQDHKQPLLSEWLKENLMIAGNKKDMVTVKKSEYHLSGQSGRK